MAFDQSSMPQDLRPVNVTRMNAEDPHISNSSGYSNPPRPDGSSPQSAPVYFTVSAADSSFTGLGFPNTALDPTQAAALPMWGGCWPAPISHPSVPPPHSSVIPPGNPSNPNPLTSRPGSNGVDQASDDGGDDSMSGRKVKFLCSFGGKIIPRPSDGMLRYVGGQTRIISVRKDVNFHELVQKMMGIYGQPVVIKYQLPDEDLDALVSVSCPDDLENMMEEYLNLLERSTDGSSKLRVFLFSTSEMEVSGLTQFEDLQDNGQKYVDAVNGVAEGVVGGITRKESIASVTSTQNSDVSGTEAVDNLVNFQEVSGLPSTSILSPGSDSTINNGNPVRSCGIDVNSSIPPPVSSTFPMVVPLASGPSPVVSSLPDTSLDRMMHLPSQQPLFKGYDLPPQHATGKFPPPPSPYLQGFVDTRQEPQSHTTTQYQNFPPSVLYGNHPMVMAGRPILMQPQFNDSISGAVPQPLLSPVHMSVAPSSPHVTANPSIIQQMPSQRVVAVPADQSYKAFQTQVHPGGVPGYGWHQVPQQEHVVFSEGWMPHHQQQVVMSESIARMEDCGMCQKQLPHAHSDSVVPDQTDSGIPTSTMSDVNSLYKSLCLDDVSRIHAMNQGNLAGQIEVAGMAQTSLEGQHQNDRAPMNKFHECDKSVLSQGSVRVTGAAQGPYGVVMGMTPQGHSEESLQHMYPQMSRVIPETFVNKPVTSVHPIGGGMPFITTEPMSNEAAVPREDQIESNTSGGFGRPVEHFQMSPPVISPGSDQGRSSPVDQPRKNDIFDQGSQQTLPNTDYTNSSLVPEVNSVLPMTSHANIEPVSANSNVPSPVSPSNWTGTMQDSANSLFSNQDPFYFRHDSHFPPPKPTKITTRREGSGPRNPQLENRLVNGEFNMQGHVDPSSLPPSSNLSKDQGSDQALSSRGSSEELVKQELKATAEGVAASALQSPISSNVNNFDGNHGTSVENNSDLTPSKTEGMNVKSEKTNPGPLPNGRLQIIKNGDLEELRELGSGTFGTVYYGKWRGTDVAIKRINDRCFAGKPSEIERMREDFWSEAAKLADLHHPNVVAFYGVVTDGPGDSMATVTEYMVNGSLRTALQKNERILDKRKKILIAMDVAFGMEYLHFRNIVHFDLKSDNLLVNLRDPHRPICKVGDLGLSKVKCQTLISGGVRGTLPWMAPELLNGSSSLVSEKVDVFSYGIVMWELITGDEPYADLHYGAIIGGIVSNTLRPTVPDDCDPDWRSLMERCWSAEPKERPCFTEVANELRAMAAKLPSKSSNQAANQRAAANNAQGP